MSTNAPLNTAVLFLVFNRPETTRRVFEAIRQAQPPRLYVAADGPRASREGEADRVREVRAIATAIDWPCEVRTLFRSENLGCKRAVEQAITWFFEHEEEGIILEDDCLPNPEFFSFCGDLLDRYRTDHRVSVITGQNYQNGLQRGAASYYFSRYNHCWGWASWRRAWQLYDGALSFWPTWRDSDSWPRTLPDAVERRYWTRIFDRMHYDPIDSWAYPWTACVWYGGGLTATPNVNMVSNIGFGPDSTHTTSANSPLAAMATHGLGPLVHPTVIALDSSADRHTFDYAFGGKWLRFPLALLRAPRRVAGYVYRRIRGGKSNGR